tara:strand:+ start:6586 stop:7110 length:525 start_codon:yes stop_codon:yes gene_type:complete
MKVKDRVDEKDYCWKIIKKDPNQVYQLIVKWADENGGMENINSIVADRGRAVKFPGVKGFFNKYLYPVDGTDEQLDAEIKFQKGFSRYLNAARKTKLKNGTKRLANTYEGWDEAYERYKKDNVASPEVNDDYSGLEPLFSPTPAATEQVDILDWIKARTRSAKLLPDGTVELVF